MGPEIMIELTRLPNWRARFDAECDRLRLSPFAWGSHDCGPGLAGNLTMAITGVDVAADYRGRYTTRTGALRVLRSGGYETVGDLVASMLPEHEHHSMARIGDVVAIPTESAFGHALGVVNGERVFVLTENGFGTVDRCEAVRAFRVG